MEFNEVIDIDEKPRTSDVRTSCSFETLMISASTITNMAKYGFRKPSPIQEKAIPPGLSGLDMLVQAKSGTGKTLVFSIMAVENLNVQSNKPQRMILAPTREIASQIKDTVQKIAPRFAKIVVLVGGNSIADDLQQLRGKAHIIIGTTGRVCHMVQEGHLCLDSIDLFVLDEADKLMENCFEKDINYLFSCMPDTRQVAVFSATYPRNLDKMLCKFMKDVTLVRLNSDDVQLVGIKQYAFNCGLMTTLNALEHFCRNLAYSQVLVFCNKIDDCQRISDFLLDCGFETSCISSKMTQQERDLAIQNLKNKKIKILVSSDLTARGIDAENVNLVINMEPAINIETYLHRIGRAARFGGIGAAITILKDKQASNSFSLLARDGKLRVNILERGYPTDLVCHATYHDACKPFKQHSSKVDSQIIERPISEDYPVEGQPYDRELVYSLRGKSGLPVPSVLNMVTEAGIRHFDFPQFSDDIRSLELKLGELSIEKDSTHTKTVKSEPAKPKYKFVPTRAKAKKKFFMRGEMIAIRDSHTPDIWRQYAETKFNMNEEPFTRASTSSSSISNIRTIQEKPALFKKTLNPNCPKIIKYSRKDMLAIQGKASKSAWLAYVNNKWDTSDEPWQLDQFLRCPFELQLRRKRIREKNERAKVVAERQKDVNKASNMAISSSRSMHRSSVNEASFNEFARNLLGEFEAFTPDSEKIGPVIPVRDSSLMWKVRLESISSWLDNYERLFNYEVEKSSSHLKETDCNTDNMESSINYDKINVESDLVSHDVIAQKKEIESYDLYHQNEKDEEVAGYDMVIPTQEIKDDIVFSEDEVIEEETLEDNDEYSVLNRLYPNNPMLGNILNSYLFLSTKVKR